MSSKDLPSIDDFAEDSSNLPSIDEFITEEVEEELPSVEDFIEKEQEIITEQTQTIEDANGETFAEVQDIVPPWPELVKMVNDIRADIPDIPEIKYYDKELEQLAEQIAQIRDEIPEVPEVRYYESEVEAICGQIDLVREEIKTKIQNLPEVKYYDEQVDQIEDRIDTLQTEVANLPEVKYYDAEIAAICEAIDAVKESIPKFPKWVNEVNEVPDFSWIGKTFSVIDDDFIKVNDTIDTLKEHVKLDIKKLVEENEVKHFENRVQFGTEVKDLDTKLGEEKDKIWKELRSSSMKIWEYHKEFKDDDKKLKKQILGEYNNLKTQIEERLVKYNIDNVKTDELLLNYFNELREEVSSIEIPEVKYYDDDIKGVKTEIKELKNLVRLIKLEQKEIQEGLLNEPTDEKQSVDGQSDPLTPLDQQFPNLKALADHYRLFITRTQQQLAVMGGGGEVRLEFLDDLDRDTALVDGKFLKYQASTKTFVGSDASGGSTALTDLTDVDTANLGDGRFLRYDATAEEFTFSPVSATNLELIAGDIQSGIKTTTSTDAATVISVSATTYRSAQYQIQVVEGTNYNMTTINVLHDGTDTYMTEFGTINQPTGIATFSTDINSGSLRLLGYPTSSNSTTFKVLFSALEI